MNRKRSKLSDQQWDDYKALIRKWYIVQDMSLKEVHNKLKEQGLDATTHQIETKTKKWKFQKKIGKETWIPIDHHITKRKRDGKESEVILSGKRIKPETVRRETDRYGDRSTLARIALELDSSLPPLTDWQVAVCTPQPITMEFEWPITLPWLKFSSRELPMILKVCKPSTLESRNAALSDLVSAILPKALRTEMAHIGVSNLAAIIGRSMPETYSQENLQRAQNILSGSADDFAREYVSMVIHNVSNNLLDLKEDSQWEQTMRVLEGCGIFRLDVDLGKDRSPTIDGFVEKLFDASIIRCWSTRYHLPGGSRAETAVKWLVRLGYCPKTAVETLFFGTDLRDFWDIPLHTQQSVLDLTKCLLNAGASTDIKGRGSLVILEIVLCRRWSSDIVFNLAELLFKHSASGNVNRALHSAIRRKEKNLVEMIIQHEGDLTAGLEPLYESPLHKDTALTVAASTGLQQTRHILDLLSSRYPSIPVTTFITPDVLIAAAAEGYDDIIYYLYSISHTIKANEYGITPLHMAARCGHLSTCQVLLPLQDASNIRATTNFSPFQAACYGGHGDVVEFFIMNGADVDAAPRFDSDVEELRFQNRFDMNLYPSGKGPLDVLLRNLGPVSRIDAGVSHSDALCCAAILIRAGAKLVGEELSTAAAFCHLELLASSIAAGANPNESDRTGKTPIQFALQGPSNRSDRLYSVVSQLLSKGAQLLGGEVDIALYLGQWEVTALLIEYGGKMTKTACKEELENAILVRDNVRAARMFDIDPSIYSAGALYAAIVMGNNSLIQSLILNRPADKREDPFEITAIAAAAISGNLVLLQELLTYPPSCHTGPLPLRKGGESIGHCVVYSLVEDIQRGQYWRWSGLDSRNIHHEFLWGSPLALVAISMRSDALEACSQLLGSDFRADELTWVVAASFNNTTFVQTLLDHNQHGDYSYRDFKGWSPLACAIGHRNKDMINLLLTAGVNVNGRAPYVGEPLAAAVTTGDLDFVRYLIQAGASVNANDGSSQFPSLLQIAVDKSRLDIVRCLIQAGADVDANYKHYLYNRSPLQAAVGGGKTDIVHCLVEAGANVNAPPAKWGGATALQLAAVNGDLGLAKYLISKRAQVNAPPSREEGRTALQGAAEHGRLDMLEFLLTEGALTGGRWRRRFIKAVKLAIAEHHYVAANILKQSAGWSEKDEELLQEVYVYYDTDSEEGEVDDAETENAMNSGDEQRNGTFS
ncbi:ankyrin repeat-containing domain protein [Xylaria grammica]|nr:ankyrin repeat-containing domain protein [Xylaria grammica]